MDRLNESQLPLYRCHKTVAAFKIGALREPPAGMPVHVHALASPAEGHGPTGVSLSGEFMAKHKPEVGGYYVLYEDGYESYSPAAAFESGYALIGVTHD